MRSVPRVFLHLILPALVLAALPWADARAAGWLGIAIETPKGVLVSEIIKDGPGDKGGLEKGDVILKMAGEELLSPLDLSRKVAMRPAGDEVELTLIRDGETITLAVTVGESHGRPSFSPPAAETVYGGVGGYDNRLPYPPADPPWPPSAPAAREQVPYAPPAYTPWSPPPPTTKQEAAPTPSPASQPKPGGAWLGVAMQTDGGGVRITAVAPDSPAQKAGLAENDLIMRINGQGVATPREMAYVIDNLDVGEDIDLAVRRSGKIRHVRATLGSRPN